MRRNGVLIIALLALLPAFAAGCGSKISEPNYYKVQHGMTEEDVDDLLGPPHHEEVAAPPATLSTATTRSTARKVKTWTRGTLSIRVVFEDGRVVGRSADGMPFEHTARRSAPTTVPTPS
jgi:hypothetical protein